MKGRKHTEINLEKRRGAYGAIGLLIAATIVLAAFEYRTIAHTYTLEGNLPTFLEEEQAINSCPKPLKLPPPPTKPINLSFLIDDGAEEDPIEFDTMEIDEDLALFVNKEVIFSEEKIVEIDPPKIISDIMPEFDGGLEKMYHYLQSNINYPEAAINTGTQGRVYLKFIVEKDGSISNISVLSEVGFGCTEEAVRVVKSMPNWKPGEHMGKKVRVIFTLPVSFLLN